MADEPVLVITGASTGIGAATAQPGASSSDTAWCWRLAPRTSCEELAGELGGDDKAMAVRCDVTSWDDQQAARGRDA